MAQCHDKTATWRSILTKSHNACSWCPPSVIAHAYNLVIVLTRHNIFNITDVCDFAAMHTRDAESSFFVGHQLWLQGLKKLRLRLRLQPLKIPRLWLRVKVRWRLPSMCDCDSVLSERCRLTNSQGVFKNDNNMGLLFLNQVKSGMAYMESSFDRTLT